MGSSHIYYSNRANAYLAQSKFKEAIEDCQQAIAIDPTYVKAFTRLGDAQLSSSLYTESIASFESALKLDPENEEIKGFLAEAIELDKFDK